MSFHGLHCLVVEDHAFQRRILVRTLETLGAAKVHAAEDGQQALSMLDTAEPPVDLVLTDAGMPGMDGVEFVRRLGAAGSGVAVILASADSAALHAIGEAARACGVRVLGSIDKPVTPDKLLELVGGLRAPAS